MIQVDLPAVVDFSCPACGASFSMATLELHELAELACPSCGKRFSFYDGLSGLTRRQVYHAVRDAMEQRVFEQYQMNRSDYFEDWGNIVSGDSAEKP